MNIIWVKIDKSMKVGTRKEGENESLCCSNENVEVRVDITLFLWGGFGSVGAGADGG